MRTDLNTSLLNAKSTIFKNS